MVIVSCQTKFHSFALAEQIDKHLALSAFFTTYAYQKNKNLRLFAKRIDKEIININKINTNILGAIKVKLISDNYKNAQYFDKWVSKKIDKLDNCKIFIGWSSMSLESIQVAKSKGMLTILERGSTHISFQNDILKTEYSKFNKNFSIDNRIIDKELKEYEQVDFISIPSNFVKETFVKQGISQNKLFVNNYGVSKYFKIDNYYTRNSKFTILYLGTISIRKGLFYFFEALLKLNININNFEVLFIGAIDDEMKPIINKYFQSNWKFIGHVNHYELSNWIKKCDIAIQPSIEEGLSMVIPQILSCGIPVIATTNTGGGEFIIDGFNGYIIPICNPLIIREKINLLYYDRKLLNDIKLNLINSSMNGLQWDEYGDRYINFLNKIIINEK